MSREAWGDPPDPEPQFCPMCGESHHTPGCEVCELDKRRIAAESELATMRAALESTAAELEAWRERFPAHVYRPQDDCVALRLEQGGK